MLVAAEQNVRDPLAGATETFTINDFGGYYLDLLSLNKSSGQARYILSCEGL